jgi:hypothetical protein
VLADFLTRQGLAVLRFDEENRADRSYTQVFAKLNQEGIRNALLNGGNKDYQVKELPGLNHMFQECKTGEMAE